jgi:hypothetical protein
MAASALTVTPPNPTPPTNFSSVGCTPPNPPNYRRQSYDGAFAQPPTNPPPFFDDGTGGSRILFAANTAALASGTSANDTGTGTTVSTAPTGAGGTGVNSVAGTYPGTGTLATDVSDVGPVPASSSVASEGAGTEVSVTATYAAGVLIPGSAATYIPTGQTPAWAEGAAGGPLITASDLGSFTGVAAPPNQQHASSLSPATNPALTSITPGSTVSGVGTTTLGATGTNFTRQSIINVNGVNQVTTFISTTSLNAPAVTKKATAGPWNVVVITGGAVVTAAQVWTFT